MRTRSPEKQTDAKQVITSLMDATEEKQRELWEGARGDTEVPICARFYSSLAPGPVLQPLHQNRPHPPEACLSPARPAD